MSSARHPTADKPRPPSDPVLAYRDQAFLDTDDARPLRILAEYLAPMRALREQQVRDTIVFFGSARIKPGGPLGRSDLGAERPLQGCEANDQPHGPDAQQ